MPWNKSNIPTSFKALKGDNLDLAISIANGVLKRCWRTANGAEERQKCEGKAIAIALSKVKEQKMNESEKKKDPAPTSAEQKQKEEITTGDALAESISLLVSITEAVVEDDGTVKTPAVLIESGWSLNDRYYKPSLLRKLASILEGVGAFDSHLKNPRPSDYVGVHKDVRVSEGAGPSGRDAVTGTFYIIDPKLQRLARLSPNLVQLSINGKGSVKRGIAEGREGLIVEDVDETTPWSCDVVVNAGARGGIGAVMEAMNEGENMDITSLQDLEKAFPNLLKEYAAKVEADLEKQGKFNELKDSLKEAEDELGKAVKDKEAAQTRIKVLESRDLLTKKLAEAKLHKVLEQRIVEQFSDKVAEAEAVDKAVNDAKELQKALSEGVKVDGVKPEQDVIEEQNKEDLELLRNAGLLTEDGDE